MEKTEGESVEMERAKKETDKESWQLEWEPSERWKAMQLTSEQKAELRRRVQLDVDRVRADGVYERLAARRGQVKFALGWWETR